MWFFLRRGKFLLKRAILRCLLGESYHPNFWGKQRELSKKKPELKRHFSLLERWRCFLSGFNTDKLLWYDFKTFPKSLYISDIVAYRDFERIDWKYYYYAHDKLVFERFFSHLCRVVPNLGLLHGGRWVRLQMTSPLTSLSDLVESVDKGAEYFLKPYDGGSGRGVIKLGAGDGSYSWSGELLTRAELLTRLESLSGYLVQQKFVQEGFSHEIHPATVNSIRVVTMISPSTHEPFVAYAAHRFGCKGSFVDNGAQGNAFAPIDLATGVLGKVLRYSPTGQISRYDKHPDTQVQIAGQAIPHWDKILSTTLRLAAAVPFLPYCGWDIILSGEEVYVQELNYNPSIYFGQVEKPLLLNPKVKEFFEYYNRSCHYA